MPHLKVQVWIHARGPARGQLQVLLLKTRPDRGSFWQPVTGSVEPGESIEAAALREAREETGLELAQAPRPLGYEFSFVDRWGREATETAFAIEIPLVNAAPPEVKLDPHEHMEAAWLDADEARGRLAFPSNEEALRLLVLNSQSVQQGV